MEKKLVAVFTVEHNETFYLPIWVKWYGKDIPPEDMYILAHNSNPEMLEMLEQAKKDGVNVEYLETNEIFNHDWLNSQVHRKQQELLEKYQYVIFTDCDELIEHKNKTLPQMLVECPEVAYRSDGWEILENKMYRSYGFCKTAISSIPLSYSHGYHTAVPDFPINKDVTMYHIHKIDYDKAWERNQRIANEQWDAHAIANDLGTHNRIVDEDKFKEWFYGNVPKANELVIGVPQRVMDKILK